METKIKNDIKTTTKKVYTSGKHKNSKLTKETQVLMNQLRQISREHPDYSERNKTIKKGIKKDARN